ncbi:hypothetical protein [Croceivirga radicis]|uniref:hypothetical protein n=1 Tax=Croceivirga radicis TaxID=1929488 RepID=UPI000255B2D7|nr:hypothetical protein [Croceivirga radicis]
MSSQAYSNLPVYQKSLALKDLSAAVAHYFAKDYSNYKLSRTASLRDVIANSLITDTSLIIASIENASNATCSASRARNASQINIIIRNLLSYCNGLEKDGVKEREYLNLLRYELKAFRKSFKVWRKSILK